MGTQIIQVPYDSGYKNCRMGLGPEHIVRHLKAKTSIPVDEVEVQDGFALEIGTSFAVARPLAEKVRKVAGGKDLPLVLAGGCISCVGTLAGLGAPPPAIIWLDAHGDFNTPETTVSGFLDGMALATAVGRCWGKLAATVPGFRPVPERQAVLVGARDFDVDERALLDRSAISFLNPQRIPSHGLRAELEPLLTKIRTYTGRAYLHIDLDVLDPAEARVNQFAVPCGLTLTELLGIVSLVRERFELAAAAITAYDPEYDDSGKAVSAAVSVIQELSKQS
ncbi:MAG: arginase family protein [Terriglobales bacterium]